MNSRIHAQAYSFLTIVLLLSFGKFGLASGDETPPLIIHEPIVSGTKGQDIPVEVIITDNIEVVAATLYYRKNGTPMYSTLSMEPCEECMDVYEAAIPASAVTTTGLEYYIWATDGTNVATQPAVNPSSLPHVIAVTGANQPPGEITLSDPSEITVNSVKLTWTQSSDEDFAKYTIYLSNSSGAFGMSIHTITNRQTTSYNVTGLQSGTTHFFTVKIVDDGNLYAFSNQVQAETQMPPAFPWIWMVALGLLVAVTTLTLTMVRKRPKGRSKKERVRVG